MEKCKYTKLNGESCKNNAKENGFCHLHQEKNIVIKENKNKDKIYLNKIIESVKKSCRKRGWNISIENVDNLEYRQFVVQVSKTIYVSGWGTKMGQAEFEYNLRSNGTISATSSVLGNNSHGVTTLFDNILDDLKHNKLAKSLNDKKIPIKKDENLELLATIFKKFHSSAIQLGKRYSNRETLKIKDEYDVQDLLHAFLKLFFSDIRAEDAVSSRAGGNSRVDFLLNDEKIIIEVKMASENLKDKKIGEQLIIDIERYKNQNKCEHLICFVYDPNFFIKNPYGLESDLSGNRDKMKVSIFIYPK
ncbi:MAG: hypothetical protein JXM74_09395 [Fusobacteriaceae bacterium]|nr:hypothetical protein [Fusobacteriaceae bacterium]